MQLAKLGFNKSMGDRLAVAFMREEQNGLAFAMWVRIAALLAIGGWLIYIVPQPRVYWWLGIVGLFMALSIGPLVVRERAPRWRLWVAGFVLLDAALLVAALLIPNPVVEPIWPPQMGLRYHNYAYLFVLLGAAALSYSPGLVLWTGAALALCWSAGNYALLRLPDSLTTATPEVNWGALDAQERLAVFLDPKFLDVVRWQNQVAILLIVTAIVAAAVWRARRLVLRQAAAERAQTNLARYFSPDVAGQIAEGERSIEAPQGRDVAVLFVDIAGFTALCEKSEPDRVIALLRSFQRRMASCVFEHRGTLDKYIGDSVMAIFGAVNPESEEATRALRCARAMIDEIERWNDKRRSRGSQPIRVGIGIHYGPVVVGNVGDDRCLEFTAIGDTVNVASRLERLTRERGAALLVSDELMQTVKQERALPSETLAEFAREGETQLPGRGAPVAVWRWRGGPGETAAPESAAAMPEETGGKAMTGETIRLTAADGHEFDAYRVRPEGEAKAGLVVIQEVFGVNSHIRSVAEGFAAEGYLVVAPALFDRRERGVELAYGEEDLARGRALRGDIPWDQVALDVTAAAEAAAAAGKVGAVGYCWGGSVAWLAASRSPVAAAVGYYGGQIKDLLEDKPVVPVLLHFGETDVHIAMADVEAVRAAYPEVPMHLYPAGHGFNCDHRADYDPESARLARERTLAFFAEHLG